MATSFADALSPLAKTMARVARNIEILRLSAQLDGEDFPASANIARAAVLKWASPARSPSAFPGTACPVARDPGKPDHRARAPLVNRWLTSD
ncbi:hypothetical protein [Roseovarius sp. TM1035]|jgi:hypothetical protein|uniref:hypothetical protein n=1 Tax=Roseovarius sp. TM1035 TaxID=391613 RepID=UPI0018DDDA3E|nr:hypothetical protein [Roseovarius sp. TM1035]